MRPGRILIVSDQRALRRGLRAGLESLQVKLNIVDVRSGEDAILVNSHQAFDLLIADAHLPGISGIELVEHAQIRNPNLQTILVASPGDPSSCELGAHAGVIAIFYKPIERDKFLRVVRECLVIETKPEIEDSALFIEPPSAAGGISERLPERFQDRFSGPLSNLRAANNAHCALLIRGDGKLLARAGELSVDVYEELLLRALSNGMAALQAAAQYAGGKLIRDIALISCDRCDLAFTHVDLSTGLMLIGPPGSFSVVLNDRFVENLQTAARDLLALLTGQGFAEGAAIADQGKGRIGSPVNKEEAAPASGFDAILQHANEIETRDADAFWESAAREQQEVPRRSETISYDQARELGLNIDGI